MPRAIAIAVMNRMFITYGSFYALPRRMQRVRMAMARVVCEPARGRGKGPHRSRTNMSSGELTHSSDVGALVALACAAYTQ